MKSGVVLVNLRNSSIGKSEKHPEINRNQEKTPGVNEKKRTGSK